MIDITFDFTSDSPDFWKGFWDRNEGLGAGGSDPDKSSPTLKFYHQLLWSRKLPNGELMKLEPGDQYTYLQWKDLRPFPSVHSALLQRLFDADHACSSRQ